MICAKCGHELTGHMKFCSHCGQKQAAGSVAPKASQIQRTPVAPKAAPIQRTPVAPQAAPIRRTPVAPNPAPAQRPMLQDYHFVLDTAKVNIIIAVVLGVLGVLMFLLMLLGAALALFTAENGLVVLALVIVTVRVSGRTLTIRKLFTKREYDCSDIVKIECLTFGYRRVCTINLTFKDGKTFRLGKNAAHAKEFAACLLDLLRAGAIPQTAIVYEHAQRLVMTTEGKSWENLSGYGWIRRGN